MAAAPPSRILPVTRPGTLVPRQRPSPCAIGHLACWPGTTGEISGQPTAHESRGEWMATSEPPYREADPPAQGQPREDPMPKLWSELPAARSRELVADVATLCWILFWGSLAWTLFAFLAQFAEAGRLVQGGGQQLNAAGNDLGGHLSGLPLVGTQVSDAVRHSFDGAAVPIVEAGRELETFVMVVAATLGLVLLLVPLIPWLSRYLPWRLERVRRLQSGERAIRRSATVALGGASQQDVDRVLAGRALQRMEWSNLLDYTPDPIGDWTSGNYDRLARAEYEAAGLRRRPAASSMT